MVETNLALKRYWKNFLSESWKSKMGVSFIGSYISNIAAFHFHDYGRQF